MTANELLFFCLGFGCGSTTFAVVTMLVLGRVVSKASAAQVSQPPSPPAAVPVPPGGKSRRTMFDPPQPRG